MLTCDNCEVATDETDIRLELTYRIPETDTTYEHLYCSPSCVVEYIERQQYSSLRSRLT